MIVMTFYLINQFKDMMCLKLMNNSIICIIWALQPGIKRLVLDIFMPLVVAALLLILCDSYLISLF